MERLCLTLHPEKTRIVELGLGKDGFTFLGCYLRVVRSHFKRATYVFRWPSPKAMTRIRARIRGLTNRGHRTGMKDIRDVIPGTESRASWLGRLLSNGAYLDRVSTDRSIRK
jgi:RNA-directed DNA polymerase